MDVEILDSLKTQCKNNDKSIQKMLRENWNKDTQHYGCLMPSLPALELYHSSNISILTDHLVLTSAPSICSEVIDDLEITNVISCALELPDIPLEPGISYLKVNVVDSPHSDLTNYFDCISDLIHQIASLNGKTIIFCVAGVSRSATLCIAYLMKYQNLSLLDAYNYVKLRRPKIRPNCGFFQQLIAYERKLFKNNTISMVFNEFVQMNIPEVYDKEYNAVRSVRYKRSVDKTRI